jgi:hypothetical protein
MRRDEMTAAKATRKAEAEPESEQQDLPWWTEEELKAVAAIDDLILATTHSDYDLPLDVTPWQLPVRRLLEQQRQQHDDEHTIEWISYKARMWTISKHLRYSSYRSCKTWRY